ncbi:MAG: hypothetical protein EBR02_02375 [Alphaproteobacteria bacterium]|nr:hypothetical protein [Alphaproteobacteria bacterium]
MLAFMFALRYEFNHSYLTTVSYTLLKQEEDYASCDSPRLEKRRDFSPVRPAVDTSEEFYPEIITTRTYQDRLDTLENVRAVGMNVCCGGIVGMGEKVEDRAGLLMSLANMPQHPQSVPINMLVQVEGTALSGHEKLSDFDFIRTIAVARVMMPKSFVRLSAGREEMNEQTQALCFLAGANSIFYGEKLLTTANPMADADMALFAKLGLSPLELKTAESSACAA